MFKVGDVVLRDVGGATRMSQDVEPLLEQNKAIRERTRGYTPSRSFRQVAEVDVTTIFSWTEADGITAQYWSWPAAQQQEYLRKKLRDPDFKAFRTDK